MLKYVSVLILLAVVSISRCSSADSACYCKCPSPRLLFKWALTKDTTGMCMDETVLQSYQNCVHHEGRNPLLQTRGVDGTHTQKKTCSMSSDCAREPIPTRSVDYLFLIETDLCTTGNSSHARTVLAAIEGLMERTRDSTVFHDVQAQYGFILYSSSAQGGLQYTYGRDFSPDFPDDLRSHLLRSEGEAECTLSSVASMSGYRRVGDAVRVMSRSLKLVDEQGKFHQRISLASNKSLYVWHRPYSDLHIVSIIDMDDTGTASDTGGREDSEEKMMRLRTKHRITKLSEKLISVPAYPVTFHMFFSISNTVGVALLGDPGRAVRYQDYSHFKKAGTLKALLAEKQGASLQALLLSRGIEFQVHFLQDLEDSECLLNISPSLTTPLNIRSEFSDPCLISRNNSDTEDLYCSSLHGWTKKRALSLNSDLFQNRVPLSSEYSSSHVDIAKSVSQNLNGSKETVPVKELSINKISSCGCERAKPVIQGQPRSVRWERDKPFVEELVNGGEPVVLQGTVVEAWPALGKWNMSYLSLHMDTDVLEHVKCTNDSLTFDPDRRAPLQLDLPLSYTLANISTSHFFQCVQSSGSCSDGYKGHYYFGQVPESLKKDVMPSEFLYHTEKDRLAAKQFMWLSSAGMITHTHFDQDYNVFVQLIGKKRFTLWSPAQHELLYMYPRVHPMWHKSRVNQRDVDSAQFPGFSRARGVQVELEPGDMLYVPPYTWHYVETLTPSVSLSTWSHDYQLYDHMNAIYRHDHKFDLLQSQRGKEQVAHCAGAS